LAAKIGQQRWLHELMTETGVQIMFYGHDHVFTDGVVDNIHYTLPGSFFHYLPTQHSLTPQPPLSHTGTRRHNQCSMEV